MKKFIYLIFCLVICLSSFAQSELQVFTKTITKTLNYKETEKIIVDGEKAKIGIGGWYRNEVEISIKLISKHPDKAIAEAELEYSKYLIQQKGKHILIKNFYAIPDKVKEVRSNLKVEYAIRVPFNCSIEVKDYFGNVHINDVTGSMKFHIQYGDLDLNNCEGLLDIDINFGDVNSRHTSGSLIVNATHSEITMKELSGTVRINAKSCDIFLVTENKLNMLLIDAEKSDVQFEGDFDQYAYELVSSYGDISIPSRRSSFLKHHPEQELFHYRSKETYPLVSIKTSFGKITVL